MGQNAKCEQLHAIQFGHHFIYILCFNRMKRPMQWVDGDQGEERDDEEEMHEVVDEDVLEDAGPGEGRCKSAACRLEHVINQELSWDIYQR